MAYQNSWTLDTIHLDMTKRRYLLLKDAYGKAKVAQVSTLLAARGGSR